MGTTEQPAVDSTTAMILTVTPNTTLDHAYVVNRLVRGGKLTALVEAECAGGKGGLLSAFAVDLGARSVALGFAAGENGRKLARLLRERKVQVDFTPVRGETRRVLTLVEKRGAGETLILPVTLRCSPRDERDLLRRARGYLIRSSWLALCGSLPPGCSPKLYAQLARLARRHGVKTFIDSRGQVLSQALGERPTVVKLNRVELEETVGRRLATEGALRRALGALVARGVEVAVCTLGAGGALAVAREAAWRVVPPRIPAFSATGAGDAFSAGLLVAQEKRLDWPEALRWAVAAGTAKALEWRTDGLQVKNVLTLIPRVRIKNL